MRPRTVSLPRQPPGRGPTGRPWCRGCWFRLGELREVPKGKRAWCSMECVLDALVRRGDPGAVRRQVEARDRGVCATCGADALLANRVLERVRRVRVWGDPFAQAALNDSIALVLGAWGAHRHGSRHLWEADHIEPVAEGGGGCGLDGYRTLCRPCHVAETRKLRGRLSRARSPQQRSLEELQP